MIRRLHCEMRRTDEESCESSCDRIIDLLEALNNESVTLVAPMRDLAIHQKRVGIVLLYL